MASTTIHQRFQLIVNELGLNTNVFSKELGVASTQIYNIINGRNAPSFDLLQKLVLTFPQFNIDWILLGKGPIINNGPADSPLNADANLSKKIKDMERQLAAIKAQLNKPTVMTEEKALKIIAKAIRKK